jgi:hypothetical protein
VSAYVAALQAGPSPASLGAGQPRGRQLRGRQLRGRSGSPG